MTEEQGPGFDFKEIAALEFQFVNMDFQTWGLMCLQRSDQPIWSPIGEPFANKYAC